jgi:hypothetical protein
MNTQRLKTTLVLAILAVAGCKSEDERIAEMAIDYARRQAEQSQRMAEMQQEVVEGSRTLVEADCRARQELLEAHRGLQTTEAELFRQRDQLEQERREIARQRRSDPIIAEAIAKLGLLLACLAPLALAGLLLHKYLNCGDTEGITQILIDEFASKEPSLLYAPRRLPAINDARECASSADGDSALEQEPSAKPDPTEGGSSSGQ